MAWSSTSEKMCELLQWARSERVADLATINDFLETLADQSELFKTVTEELQQQKQVCSINGTSEFIRAIIIADSPPWQFHYESQFLFSYV